MEKNEQGTTSCTGCGGMDRRTFLSNSMMAAAALALAACAASDMTGISTGQSIKVSDHPELATVGGVASFSLNGTPIAVVRTDASTFVVLSRVCPHQGSTVSSNGNGFTCPNHGARFSKTGTWIGGERTSSLRTFASTYDATAGTITIG